MKLDRNIAGNAGRGKYALILLRKLPAPSNPAGSIWDAIRLLDREGVIDWGEQGSDSEFFVMRLKDRHAAAGLRGYEVDAREHGDQEWAGEVGELADRAGPYHPACQLPD